MFAGQYLSTMRPILTTVLAILVSMLNAQGIESSTLIEKVINEGYQLPPDLYVGPLDVKDSLRDRDLSPLWSITPNDAVYGFIGANFQRLRVKFLSIAKNDSRAHVYQVHGKCMVKSNICEFRGEATVTRISPLLLIGNRGGVEKFKDSLQGRFVALGTYRFVEDFKQAHAGIFEGTFATYFYVAHDGELRYDDIEGESDSFCNNQFAGSWRAYASHMAQTCNWGDYRIPFGEAMDMGAGEFSPADEYLKQGWQSYRDAYHGLPNAKALAIERAEWWK